MHHYGGNRNNLSTREGIYTEGQVPQDVAALHW
jgi:hypothetical protein